jgi:hypothetical protein
VSIIVVIFMGAGGAVLVYANSLPIVKKVIGNPTGYRNQFYSSVALVELDAEFRCVFTECCSSNATSRAELLPCPAGVADVPMGVCDAIASLDATLLTANCRKADDFVIAMIDFMSAHVTSVGNAAVCVGSVALLCLLFTIWILQKAKAELAGAAPRGPVKHRKGSKAGGGSGVGAEGDLERDEESGGADGSDEGDETSDGEGSVSSSSSSELSSSSSSSSGGGGSDDDDGSLSGDGSDQRDGRDAVQKVQIEVSVATAAISLDAPLASRGASGTTPATSVHGAEDAEDGWDAPAVSWR